MTHQKRYTAEEMLAKSNRFDWTGAETAEMLRQAAETESQVAGLVEFAEWVSEQTDDVSARHRARKVLSKFRGEA